MDERFKLDERFIENDQIQDENDTTQVGDESDLKKEKELELNILEDILGVPCVPKNKSAASESKSATKGMIRYDPTKDNHKEYEVDTEKLKATKKKVEKKKKTKETTESVTENPPIEVSKDIYFSVSESLSRTLKEGGQFSLLNTFGKNNEKEGDDDNNAAIIEPSQPPKFQFEFSSKNPFKYDSSDDENEDTEVFENNEQNIKDDVIQDTHKFFFDDNDTRFNEAVHFFSKEFTENDTFKDLRHELKQIVRSKIRNNIKKIQPLGRKNKIKRLSKKIH